MITNQTSQKILENSRHVIKKQARHPIPKENLPASLALHKLFTEIKANRIVLFTVALVPLKYRRVRWVFGSRTCTTVRALWGGSSQSSFPVRRSCRSRSGPGSCRMFSLILPVFPESSLDIGGEKERINTEKIIKL